MKYTDVAQTVINNTISSAVYIDDKIAEPFEVNPNEKYLEQSTSIFNSFRERNCVIDFIKYSNEGQFDSRKDSMFKGRDLLILDWQLESVAPEYRKTLEILHQAVFTNHLHFVCIYTQETDFKDIFYRVSAYFCNASKANPEEIYNELIALIEDNGGDIKEVFTEQVQGYFKNLVTDPSKASKNFSDIRSHFSNYAKKIGVTEQDIINIIKPLTGGNLIKAFTILGYYINGSVSKSDNQNVVEIEYLPDGSTAIINHTIVKLINKDDVSAQSLYQSFTNAIIDGSGNFLTLMGLEMRNLFKESSAFIGKDIDKIDELAFFHHETTIQPEEAFYDFLKDLWKDQASAFLMEKHKQPQLFKALQDYKESKDLNGKIEEFKTNTNGNNDKELAKLNYYYNTLNIVRKDNDNVRFGDIFQLIDGGESKQEFYLCITAHCDCLHTDNMNNMFYFVKGSKGNLRASLELGDQGFISYINVNGKAIDSIVWTDKPITLYIAKKDNNLDSPIPVRIGPKEAHLQHICCLKENYAQRIANRAFSHPLRVGIFFADFKPVKNNETSTCSAGTCKV